MIADRVLGAASPALVRIPGRPFWGLFAVAGAIFLFDGLTTMLVLAGVPGARELNPIAALALAAGPLAAASLKAVVLGEVGLSALALRRLDADGAARMLFYVLAAAGAWGVGTAFGVAFVAEVT